MRREKIVDAVFFRYPGSFLLALVAAMGCAHIDRAIFGRPFEPTSAAGFKRISAGALGRDAHHSVDSPLLWAYSSHIGPSIFSECKNAPSDSQYLRLMFRQRCSSSIALMSAIGRMLREHDLSHVSPHLPFVLHGRLVWADFPFLCAE